MAERLLLLDSLPNEVLLNIISYLSFHDRQQNLARVCKKFLALSRVPAKIETPLNLVIYEDGWANFNSNLLKLHKQSRRLEITFKSGDSPKQKRLSQKRPENGLDRMAQWIVLAHIYNHDKSKLSAHQRDWDKLIRQGQLNVLDQQFLSLAQVNYNHLTFKGTTIDPDYLRRFPTRQLKNVTCLDLSGCQFKSNGRVDIHPEDVLVKFLDSCPHLEQIYLKETTVRMLANLAVKTSSRIRAISVGKFRAEGFLRPNVLRNMYPKMRGSHRGPVSDDKLINGCHIILCLHVLFRQTQHGCLVTDPSPDNDRRRVNMLWDAIGGCCNLTQFKLPYSKQCWTTMAGLTNLTRLGFVFQEYKRESPFLGAIPAIDRHDPPENCVIMSENVQQLTLSSKFYKKNNASML